MLRLLRHRRYRPLRLPALALLLLAMLANSVLASLGDVHELMGADGHAHAGTLHGDPTQEYRPPAAGQDDEAGLLHALLHASHCCGHQTAVAGSVSLAVAAVPAATAYPDLSVPPPGARQESRFRPPIAA